MSDSSLTNTRFAVIGGGNGGFAVAGHLALSGAKVVLYNRSIERIKDISATREVTLTGLLKGTAKLAKVTTNLAETLEEADFITVVVTADAHGDLARLMAQHLSEDQVVILSPGRTGGVLEFYNTALKAGASRNITVAETDTLAYVCRKSNTRIVEIKGLKDRVLLASLSSRQSEMIIQALSSIYPQLRKANILETSLQNMGAMIHPVIALFNIDRISKAEDFQFYIDGVTPEVENHILAVDAERVKIARKLNVRVTDIMEWLDITYGIRASSLLAAMKSNPSYKGLKAPESINRYITEDIPTGLVPLACFGKALGIKTAVINEIIDWACEVASQNFWDTGRTLHKMGLDEATLKEQLAAIIKAP